MPSKHLWEKNRQKPKVSNPGRRRKDFREILAGFERDADSGSANKVKLSQKVKYVSIGNILIQKRSDDIHITKLFISFLKKNASPNFQIVNIKDKVTKKDFTVQQYLKRPSLGAFITFFKWNSFRLGAEDKKLCRSFLQNLSKKNVVHRTFGILPSKSWRFHDRRTLKSVLLSLEEELNLLWGKFMDTAGYRRHFSSQNQIVCDINSSGVVKLAIIDV